MWYHVLHYGIVQVSTKSHPSSTLKSFFLNRLSNVLSLPYFLIKYCSETEQSMLAIKAIKDTPKNVYFQLRLPLCETTEQYLALLQCMDGHRESAWDLGSNQLEGCILNWRKERSLLLTPNSRWPIVQ